MYQKLHFEKVRFRTLSFLAIHSEFRNVKWTKISIHNLVMQIRISTHSQNYFFRHDIINHPKMLLFIFTRGHIYLIISVKIITLV